MNIFSFLSREKLAPRKLKMDDIKLNYIMRRYRPIFRGVFGKNEFKDIKITRYLFSVISNESDLGTRGTHWVAIYCVWMEIVIISIPMVIYQFQTLEDLLANILGVITAVK